MTYKVLRGIIAKLLENRGSTIKFGEQSLKNLNTQGKQLESVNMPGEDIKNFRKRLNQYNVDFSVMRDRASGVFNVFFKGQDVDRVYKALELCTKDIPLGRSPGKSASEVIADAMKKAAGQEISAKDVPERKAAEL